MRFAALYAGAAARAMANGTPACKVRGGRQTAAVCGKWRGSALPSIGEFAVFAIFLPALAESGPAPGGRGWDDAICGVFREAARALRRKAHAGCRAARPDRTGAAPLARQGKILNCVVIYCFPPASRRGRRRFARRVRVCAPWGGALVLLCAAGRPQCVGNRGVQNLPSRPARAGPRPVGAAGTIRFAAVYREAARALQRCGSPRNRRSMRKMAAFCFSSPL